MKKQKKTIKKFFLYKTVLIYNYNNKYIIEN